MEKTELHKIKTMKIKKDRKNKVNLSTLLVSLPAAAHQTLTRTFFELMLKILYRHNFLRIDWGRGNRTCFIQHNLSKNQAYNGYLKYTDEKTRFQFSHHILQTEKRKQKP